MRSPWWGRRKDRHRLPRSQPGRGPGAAEATEPRRAQSSRPNSWSDRAFSSSRASALSRSGLQALEALLGTGTQRAEPDLELLLKHRPLALQARAGKPFSNVVTAMAWVP